MNARPSLCLAVALSTAGCGGLTSIPGPQPPGMLALAYQGKLQVWESGESIAAEPAFDGLQERVHCVPGARKHARAARRHGRRARNLGWAGGTLGVASLAGLGGLAVVGEHPRAGAAVIGSGLAIGLLGIVLAGTARTNRNRAAGHAVDAVNLYNDATRRCPRNDAEAGQNAAREYPTRYRRIPGPMPPPDAVGE